MSAGRDATGYTSNMESGCNHSTIMTVNGPIDPGDFGFVLPHEHVLVDFGGAATAGPHRYNRDEVVARMEPFLLDAYAEGVRGFVDCSPMYLARDVHVLRELSQRTGLHIVTNTGMYKEPFLPEYALSAPAEQLAEEWISEWESGIDGTTVRPGFIKTAVEPVSLAPVQRKIITAAALTSRATGLTIGTHTCAAIPALEILTILNQHGITPEKWIFIHANMESDHEVLHIVARHGCWIELDAIGRAPDAESLALLLKLLDWGYEDRLLLSHDSGWYAAGEENGGSPNGYTYLSRSFVPAMERVGIGRETISKLTVHNPALAFAV